MRREEVPPTRHPEGEKGGEGLVEGLMAWLGSKLAVADLATLEEGLEGSA
jgi:hypothetical protein